MNKLWRRTLINWKDPASWGPALSNWLRSHLNGRGIRHLQRMDEQDLCWDDLTWLEIAQSVLDTDIDEVTSLLSDALSFAQVRAYHGCRTVDAGSYQREGIRLNDPFILAEELRRLVATDDHFAIFRPDIERRIAAFDQKGRDTGKLYLVLDDRTLVNGTGHYLLYGSEWMQCILGFAAHSALRRWGCPTIVQVQMPLGIVSSATRADLASALLQEWTRIKVNKPNWTPERNFTFLLRMPVPPGMVIGHEHPTCIEDPYHQHMKRQNDRSVCPSCRS